MPYKLSTYGNIVSSLFGLPFVAINIFVWIPAVAIDSEVMYFLRKGDSSWVLFWWSFFGVLIGIAFNWWLSSIIEYKFAQRKGPWSEDGLSKNLFYRVNAASYGVLLLFFLKIPINQFRLLKDRPYLVSSIIEHSSRLGRLDFRKFAPSEWDEITIWKPYGNICTLGIVGYEKSGKNCKSSKDDGETYLIFLKENQVAFIAPYSRRFADFATSELPSRIGREKAIFKISKNLYAKKVQLEVPENSIQ